MRHAWLMLLLALLSVALPARADEPKQVLVAEIVGQNAAAIRARIVRALKEHSELRVVSFERVKKITKAADELSESDVAALGIAVIVDGKVSGNKASIRVRGGGVTESTTFQGDSASDLAEQVEKTAWKQLGPAIGDAKAPERTGKKRIFVRKLSGPKSDTVHAWVSKALNRKKGVTLVASGERKDANLADDPSTKDLAEVAERLDVSLFVGGKVTVKGRKASIELTLHDGNGEALDRVSLEAANLLALKRRIDKALVKQAKSSIDSSHPPLLPEEEVEDVAIEESASEEAEATPDKTEESDTRPSALEVGLGLRAFSRQLRYTDDIFDQLREYELGSAPAAFGWLRWYPAAHFTGGVASHIGLVGSYERGFALKSKVSGGESFDTFMSEWQVGVRGRIPFFPHELGIEGTYGVHTFSVDDDPLSPLVPDVKYRFIRIGIDGRARISHVIIGAHFGYRIVTSAGAIETDFWFPRLSVGGVDAGVLGGYEILPGLDLLAGFDFRRYFYSMNPEPGDRYVVGGARDEYIAGWGGLEFRLPGNP